MDVFNKNFFGDWRKVMSSDEKKLITDLKKCNFKKMNAYFTEQSELRKGRSKDEKQVKYLVKISFFSVWQTINTFRNGSARHVML